MKKPKLRIPKINLKNKNYRKWALYGIIGIILLYSAAVFLNLAPRIDIPDNLFSFNQTTQPVTTPGYSKTGILCSAYAPWQMPLECSGQNLTSQEDPELLAICKIMAVQKSNNLTIGNRTFYRFNEVCFFIRNP